MAAVLRKGLIGVAAAAAFLMLAAVLAAPAQAEVTSVQVKGAYIYRAETSTNETSYDVSFDPESNTLTMDNTNLSYSDPSAIVISGSASDTVNVKLVGTSTLTEGGEPTPPWYGIKSDTKLVFSGGTLTIPYCDYGIQAAAVTIKSGTYNLNKCGTGISGDQYVKLEGGTCKINAGGYALYSEDGMVSNDPARLGSITGRLGEGARYTTGGTTYAVSSYASVTLNTYGGSSKKVTVDESAFGGVDYGVTAIAAKAFKNSKGAKVKTLTLGSGVRTVGKKAFFGMKKLTKLDLRSNDYYMPKSGGKFNKKAFSGCGKKKGKKLTVRTGWSSKSYINKARKALIKKGLSKKAKVKK